MGKPKFFRWMSERYPLCCQTLDKTTQATIPTPFDTFYIDLSGIIRYCAYPIDGDVGPAVEENEIFADVCHYIDHLFQLVRPRRYCYLAINGVPPRAKMTRIRCKSYLYAKVQQDLAKKARDAGQTVSFDKVGDNNALMGGTGFMDRLSEWLRYFLACKVADDATWHSVTVVLSSNDIPGEGEHKIMEDIRRKYIQNEYSRDTRHCIYSPSPDPLILAMTLHLPYITIIREKIRLGVHPTIRHVVEAQTFQFWHTCLLRDYIQLEFESAKKIMGARFDIENVIDDYILLATLVGSDYLPHLPELHVHEDALGKLFEIYNKSLPTLGGYLSYRGDIHFGQLEKLLRLFHGFDAQMLMEEAIDDVEQTSRSLCDMDMLIRIRDFMEQPNERIISLKMPSVSSDPMWTLLDATCQQLSLAYETGEEGEERNGTDYTTELQSLFDMCEPCGHRSHWEDEASGAIRPKWLNYLKEFYYKKFDIDHNDASQVQQVVHEYARGLQWCMHLYYHGVPSWQWHYPYNYAPRIIDMVNLSDVNVDFELGSPLGIFEFIMMVLPSFSYRLVPHPYQRLMRDATSPIIDYYPSSIEIDYNGKLAPWEAIFQLPIIDLARLQKAMSAHEMALSYKERLRMETGRIYQFKHTPMPDHLARSPKPDLFPDKWKSRCKSELQSIPPPVVKQPTYVPQLSVEDSMIETTKLVCPTMMNIPLKVQTCQYGHRVDRIVTRFAVTILQPAYPETETESVAQKYLGVKVLFYWPYGHRGQVAAISDKHARYELDKQGEITTIKHTPKDAQKWQVDMRAVINDYKSKAAIELPPLFQLAHIRPLKETFRDVDGALEYKYVKYEPEILYPIHMLIKDPCTKETDSMVQLPFRSIEKQFPIDSHIIFLGIDYYGYPAKVFKHADTTFSILKSYYVYPRKISRLATSDAGRRENYVPTMILARKLKMDQFMLSRITSCLLVEDETTKKRHNIGLYLKAHAKRMKIDGYTRMTLQGWEYSTQACKAIEEYCNIFPDLIDALRRFNGPDTVSIQSLFPSSNPMNRINQILEWLNKREWKISHVRAIEKSIKASPNFDHIMDPGPIIFHNVSIEMILDPKREYEFLSRQQFRLGDRVIYLYEGAGGPGIGSHGTVVGCINDLLDVLLDQPYIGANNLNGRSSPHRGLSMHKRHFLNQTNRQVYNSAIPLAMDMDDTSNTSTSWSRTMESKSIDHLTDDMRHLSVKGTLSKRSPRQSTPLSPPMSDEASSISLADTIYSKPDTVVSPNNTASTIDSPYHHRRRAASPKPSTNKLPSPFSNRSKDPKTKLPPSKWKPSESKKPVKSTAKSMNPALKTNKNIVSK
ncbi:XRN 5'-3' exonuclease N-terminus-domain-containing protein [Syncephalis fuscata]|nr:XRN 5'-3' exonuclease N-terminus-domain-containing protein [Syncephalis fuscata]